MKRFLDFIAGVPLIKIFSLIKGKKKNQPASINKILIIKLAAAGDTILLLTALKSLKEAYPAAHIDVVVSRINIDIIKLSDDINKTYMFASHSPLSLLKLAKELRQIQYDVIVDLEQWARGTALLGYFSKPSFYIGFDTPGQYREGVFDAVYKKLYNQHELEEFLCVLDLIGKKLSRLSTLNLSETEKGKLEVALIHPLKKDNQLAVLFHPGCGGDGLPREWPLESYAVLGQWLIKNANAKIFLTSGPEEVYKTRKLYRLLNNQAIDLGGRLSWPGTFSLVKVMDLVVSGNTGIMHAAAAMGVKQVALHGPTNPILWGPLNKQAVVIQSTCPQCPSLKLGFEYHTKSQDCMKKIEISEVKKAVETLIDINPGIC